MSGRALSSSNKLLFVACLLLSIDICVRWFGAVPVEATRISGRETDAAFQNLSSANYSLAQASQGLAVSIERLSAELRSMELDKWIKSEGEMAKAQEALAKSSETLAKSLITVADAMKATDRGVPDSGTVGEEPAVSEKAAPATR